MSNFTQQLDKKYLEFTQFNDSREYSKLEFLGDQVFEFITYDGEMDALFASKMIDVLTCILTRTTFDYIGKDYITYLAMVNMPFLKDKLDWGGSIRGAWFDYDAHEIGGIKIAAGELSEFITQLIDWSKVVPAKLIECANNKLEHKTP